MPTAAMRSSGTLREPERWRRGWIDESRPPRTGQLQGLPTLTEVIELPPAPRDAAPGSLSGGPAAAPQSAGSGRGWRAAGARGQRELLVERVLADLQRHADLMLEFRLREALTPALARLADALVRDVRLEFAATLRDMVERAVSQELARQRGR